jgi:HAD superfamily hydrolase (TIGR01509 family)
MIRAVVFDMNGVLVDDEHLHFELFRDVLAAEEGLRLTERDYLDRYLGYDDRGAFGAVIADAGRAVTDGRLAELISRKAVLYRERAAAGLRMFPGARESLASLGGRWPIGVCSGALRGEVEMVLGILGARELVEAVVAAEDTQRSKPDPEGYLLVLEMMRSRVGMDLEAGHCLVIEDSGAGIEAAKGAGMWVVGVEHSYPAEVLRRAGADLVIPDLRGVDADWASRLFRPEVWP